MQSEGSQGRRLSVGVTGVPEPILTGMPRRVADEGTEKGSTFGILREHEFRVEHAGWEVLGHVSTFVADRMTRRPDAEGQARAEEDGRPLGEDAGGTLRLAEMPRDREAGRGNRSHGSTLGRTHSAGQQAAPSPGETPDNRQRLLLGGMTARGFRFPPVPFSFQYLPSFLQQSVTFTRRNKGFADMGHKYMFTVYELAHRLVMVLTRLNTRQSKAHFSKTTADGNS